MWCHQQSKASLIVPVGQNVLLLIGIGGSIKQTTLSVSDQLISSISGHTNWFSTPTRFMHFTSIYSSSIVAISSGYQLEENLTTTQQPIIIFGSEDDIKAFL